MADDFTDLLASVGLPPAETKLLRHDNRGLAALQRGREWFGSFISYQSRTNSPFLTGARFAAHFVAGPPMLNGSSTAIFVGSTEILDRWPWDGRRFPELWLPEDRIADISREEAVDQRWYRTALDDEKDLLVDWGYAPRAWHQWANQKRKPLLRCNDGVAGVALKQTSPVTLLTEAQRRLETLKIEDATIRSEIDRSAELLNRSFETSIREARPLQNIFRRSLIGMYGAACAISQCTVLEALEAVHIIPFAEGRPGRDLPSNGLLLRSDLHRLFDLHLISIDPSARTVWLHPSLRDGHYAEMHDKEIETFASNAALTEHFRRRQAA